MFLQNLRVDAALERKNYSIDFHQIRNKRINQAITYALRLLLSILHTVVSRVREDAGRTLTEG